MHKIKIGDRVEYKDSDINTYVVLDVTSDKVLLSINGYDEIEQDFYTDIDEIQLMDININ